jgi:acetolactate synthase I/II/III large subunit
MMATHPTTNAELLAARLASRGVRYVFGIPSGQILPMVEGLERHGIRFVLVSHEMSAAFMADVVGRLTGVPGVALATLGPGATNLATGVGNALLERSPSLILTGQVATRQQGRRVQMHVDHQALFAPLVKQSLRLEPGRVVATLDRALALALAEPPGPVHLDLPEDVLAAPLAERPGRPAAVRRPAPPRLTGVRAAGRLLGAARRPVAVLGLSAARSGARRGIRRFLERFGIPYVTTMMGKGVIPDPHPLSIGVVGRARHLWVEGFLQDADLILGLGYDGVEIGYEDWMPDVPLIHVDREAAEADARVRIAAEVRGDLDAALAALAAMPLARTEWDLHAVRAFQVRLAAGVRPAADGFQPHQVLDLLRAWLPADGILACDVGAHTHLVASQWPVPEGGALLVSNGWSSMGYGIPAALGAKLASPAREVVCLVGDGGFLMQAGEMATASRLGCRVLFVVLEDGSLSLIEAKQRHRGFRVAGVRLPVTPSPEHYFGVPCLSARTPAEFRAALTRARRTRGPLVIAARVDGSRYSELLYT